MADSDKQFRISILIDGTEQAVKTTGETRQAFDDLAKTIGTASSSGGSGLTQNVAALQKATEAQAKASGISYEALRKETEALKENSKAKRENAGSGGDGSSGRSVLSAKDQAALDVRDFNAVVEAAEKKAADLASKTGSLRQTASETAKAFGEFAGSIPGLEGVGKSLAKLENPIGLIIETAKFARNQVADLLDTFKEADAEGYEKFAKTNGALIALIHPMDEAKKTFREFVDWVTDGSYTVMDKLKASRERADEMKKKLEELKEARRKEKEEYQDKVIQDRLIAETREIDNQSAAYERRRNVQKAKESAEEAAAKLADKQALAAGADPYQVEMGAATREANRDFAELQKREEALENKVKIAEERAESLESALSDAENSGHTEKRKIEQLKKQVDEAHNTVNEDREDLNSFKEEAEYKADEINTKTTETMGNTHRETMETLQEGGQKINSAVKQETESMLADVMKASNGVLNGFSKGYVARIQEILSDGDGDGGQADQIAGLLAGIRQDQNIKDTNTLQRLQQIQGDLLGKKQQFDDIDRQMKMILAYTSNQIAQANENTRLLKMVLGRATTPGPQR